MVLVIAGASGVGLGLAPPVEPPATGVGQAQVVSSGGAAEPPLGPSAPVRLEIPSVAVATEIASVGLNPDGTLEVPGRPTLAGWYSGSPTPGERGPAIVAGHVDSEKGPAIFYRLGEIATKARIVVTRADGSVAVFVVTAVRSYAKSDFPTQTVYGNTDEATLRLITCGGWNGETRDYDRNIVVFAELRHRPA